MNEPLTSKELFVQARDLLRRIAGETDAARMEVNAWEAMELSRKMQSVDVAPIAKLTVRDGLVQRAGLYAPGLPDGDHDVFPVPLSPKGELRPHVLAEPPTVAHLPTRCADEHQEITFVGERCPLCEALEQWVADVNQPRQPTEVLPYLKDGESVPECIERNRADVVLALGLLAKEKATTERLEKRVKDARELLVAWFNYDSEDVQFQRPPTDATKRFLGIAAVTKNSCHCPAKPGEDCPLTLEQCDARVADETEATQVTTYEVGETSGVCKHCGLSWLLHIAEDDRGRKNVCAPIKRAESETDGRL